MWDKLYELFVMFMTFLYGLFGKEYNPTETNTKPAENTEEKND